MGCKASVATSPSRPQARSTQNKFCEFSVTLTKVEGVPLGAALHSPCKGRIDVASISKKGLVHQWNQQNPAQAIRPGDEIATVNGIHAAEADFYDVLAKFGEPGTIEVVVQRNLSIEALVESCDASFFVSHYRHLVNSRGGTLIDSLPHCRACDCHATECAICLESYDDPETRLVKLPCNHAFHPACLAQWCCKGSEVCPLCKREITLTSQHHEKVRSGQPTNLHAVFFDRAGNLIIVPGDGSVRTPGDALLGPPAKHNI
jgi:hypothetical protein